MNDELAPEAAQALLAFPCEFPIKVMGRREAGFAPAVLQAVRKHAPDFEPASMRVRSSRQGTYLSLTCVVRAASREQLDALYRDLCDLPSVVVVL